jgi:hemerythrin
MPLIKWDESFSVKNESLDSQHKYLIELINKLHDMMGAGKGSTELPATLEKMIQYSNSHFADEEKLMVSYKYPGLEEQKAAHASYTKKVLELKKKFDTGQLALSVETMNFLKEWWTKHILEMDKKYSSYLK